MRLNHASAPKNVSLLCQIAETPHRFMARHAVYTGPEISCPIDANSLPFPVDVAKLPLERPTSKPGAGDLVIVCAEAGRWGNFPEMPLIDVGIFYDRGGELVFPFGKIQGTVVGRCESSQLDALLSLGRNLHGREDVPLSVEIER